MRKKVKKLEASYLCAGCNCYFSQQRWGRTRRFCSDACKMQAYRRRRKPPGGRFVQTSREDLALIKKLKAAPLDEKKALAVSILENDNELREAFNKWALIQEMGAMLRELGIE
ncbi:MAG: hypothetical protein ACJ74G_03705 [Blastocatellia bacterium]